MRSSVAVPAGSGRRADERLREAPEGVAAEADRHQHQQDVAEGLVGDRLQRALLAGRLPPTPWASRIASMPIRL